jgi:hypothetical protein
MKGFMEITRPMDREEYTVTHSDLGRSVDMSVDKSNESIEFDVVGAETVDDVAESFGFTILSSVSIAHQGWNGLKLIYDGTATEPNGNVVGMKIWQELSV